MNHPSRPNLSFLMQLSDGMMMRIPRVKMVSENINDHDEEALQCRRETVMEGTPD